jgi:hypothetical protein
VAGWRRRLAVIGLGLLVVGVVTGCQVNAQSEATDDGDGGGGTATTAAPTGSTAVSAPSSTLPVVTGPQGDVLEDGRHFALLRSLAPATAPGAAGSAELDLAQWFEGDAADAAAAEDGVIAQGQQVENDYYIRNVSDRLRTMPVTGDAATQVVDWENCCVLVPSTVDDLAARGFADGHDAFWLDVQAGQVVGLQEQFRP